MALAIFGITNSGLNLVATLFVLMLVVALAGADRLHLPRRPPPHLRPLPGRLRDDRLLLPLHRHRRLRDRAAAGVPRGRPRARAGDQSRRAAGAPAARADLPQLRVPGREELPALPQLPAPPQGPLPDLRQAGRPALGPLPLLRDRARAAARERAAPPPSERASRAPRAREPAAPRATPPKRQPPGAKKPPAAQTNLPRAPAKSRPASASARGAQPQTTAKEPQP